MGAAAQSPTKLLLPVAEARSLAGGGSGGQNGSSLDPFWTVQARRRRQPPPSSPFSQRRSTGGPRPPSSGRGRLWTATDCLSLGCRRQPLRLSRLVQRRGLFPRSQKAGKSLRPGPQKSSPEFGPPALKFSLEMGFVTTMIVQVDSRSSLSGECCGHGHRDSHCLAVPHADRDTDSETVLVWQFQYRDPGYLNTIRARAR